MIARMLRGKRIVEAKYPLTLNVKQQDIETSRRKNPEQCAIARCAVRDKHVESAHIGKKFALLEFKSHFERYQVATMTKQMVADFDENGVFFAGEYKLLPPSKSERLTGKNKNKNPNKSSGKSGTSLAKRPRTRNIFRSKEKVNA